MPEYEQSNDPKVKFKAVTLKDMKRIDPEGKGRIILSLSKEETVGLLQALTELKDSERGVKFDIHVCPSQFDGAAPEYAYGFVKKVGEPPGIGAPRMAFARKAPATTTLKA